MNRGMEHLSVTTASIGLLAVGGKILDMLLEVNTVLSPSTTLLNEAMLESKQCRSSAHILYKTLCLLESARLPFPERSTWIQADDVVVTMADTVLAFSELQDVCYAIENLLSASTDHTIICEKFDPKLRSLCARIRWHNLSMTMMTTVLQCPGLVDAENSRASLEKRIIRLLSSNSELANRMRTLIDVFANIHGPAGSLVNYRLAAQQRIAEEDVASSSSSQGSGRRGAWSTLSGYTLADMPIMSVIPIPVTVGELLDGEQFYTFEFARRVSHDLSELMKAEAGQGTSRSLGFILGKPANFAHYNSSSRNIKAASEPILPSTNPTVVVPQPRKKKKRWR
ncbi:hypothetical protein CRV24_007378 [Beauveria bassiana]|uniref:Uncharacterized protein n=1 Tax=Beauveria bassiana (strain ARSEF 2860) TaxID=655819 RepID=J4UHH5_BEAB2|nr:uncharacterized protein BBA_08372 [Beauveria bassiana ARSEF 2860]EJP62657.1 hypothetical protein BBA_08372 [Beauveria bassiana ARSEF 2860]KAF1733477.1 hypothetical protein CRV24_007378 [Beauveria bassiana]KAH8712437.1 hypothetical protein HC256_005634 [Beauveria bassiana]